MVFHRVPRILDVLRLIDLLEALGTQVNWLSESSLELTFEPNRFDPTFLTSETFRARAGTLRGSVMLVGPLLGRFGKAVLPKPGGDKIGRRRLDTHLEALEALGALIRWDSAISGWTLEAPKRGLTGAYILLEEASVTGTANLLMAAVLAEGTTTVFHAACEPYIQQLCHLLTTMGARIEGIGSNLLTIHGVSSLTGATHTLEPDMIEVGSFIGLAALTQSEITIPDLKIASLGIIPRIFRKLGVRMEVNTEKEYIRIPAQEVCEICTYSDGGILTVSDHPWPGFTPDLMSIVVVLATQCRGTVLAHQKMFESRLFFVDKLIDMGAQIILNDPHRATVIGLGRAHRLRAIHMTSPDIRAGVALLMAAMSAEGTSRIYNIEQIDRGYEQIETRLNAIGARIRRVKN
jgi:UDP-N-acetylglucosamine 1-carboxyvinyltransferase